MTPHDTEQIHLSVDHLFRLRAGQMVATLTRIFGIEKLDLVEDAVQEALVRALRHWPYQGVPNNPTAWLIQVAKNLLLDRLRRESREVRDEEIEALTRGVDDLATDSETVFAREVRDDQLRMIFICCHPVIPEEAQVALTLKTIGGFSTSEIARAFLAKDAAITKMLVRAKQRLREHHIRLEMPLPDKMPARLDSALKVIYLMFNEGYSALEGEELVRTDLCYEAIRLCELLAAHSVTASPKIHALAALLLFQGARLRARCDAAGQQLLLAEQNRSLWDPQLLRRGLHHFQMSASGNEVSDYHLEAEIAACHALAGSYETTDWERVLSCYEELLKRKPSPVVRLNHIVALAKVRGTEAGLKELETLREHRALSHYYPLYATHGELLRESERYEEAMDCYRQALGLTSSEPIRRFLMRRINEVSAATSIVVFYPD